MTVTSGQIYTTCTAGQTANFYNQGFGFLTNGSLALDTDVPAGNYYNAGIRQSAGGAIYITTTLAGTDVWVGGLRVSTLGQLVCSESASTNYVNGNPLTATGALSCTDATSAPTDPFFSSVTALLHMDGLQGATTTTDVKGHAVTVNAGSALDTSAAKFGATGMKWTSGAMVSIANNGDYNFGTGDFTVEGWFYLPTAVVGIGSRYTLFSKGQINSTSDSWCYFDEAGTRFLHAAAVNGAGATIGSVTGSTNFPIDTWTHVAWTRTSGTFRLFMGGVQQGSNGGSAAAIRETASAVQKIGLWTNGDPWRGYFDEFRITKGVSRYTANFTPPTLPFPDL